MKTLFTFLLVVLCCIAKAQLPFKPSIEMNTGLKSTSANFALMPNKSFFMFELGLTYANYGFTDTSNNKQQSVNPRTTAVTMTIGASLFNGTYSPSVDVIPYAFVSMNQNIGAFGGGLKVLKHIDALNLYLGGYTQYTTSDYTKFFDAGVSVSYYFAQ